MPKQKDSKAGDTYHNRYAPDRKHNKGDKKFKPLKKKCSKCGTTSGQLDINHKDGNRSNNNRSNLQYMCRSCHRKMHAKKNGGKGSLDNLVLSLAARIIDDPKSLESRAAIDAHQNSDIMHVEYILCHANTNANRDKFTSEDMKQATHTIINKPLNWEHKAQVNVGVNYEARFVSIKDLNAEATAYYKEFDPLEYDFIVVKAAVWEYKFPEEARIMREREEEGNLLFSMENYFETAKCTICDEEFPIGKSNLYCDHLLTRRQTGEGARQFINSNFVGSAVTRGPADVDAGALALASLENRGFIGSNLISSKLLSKMDIEKDIIPYIVLSGNNDMKINKLEKIPTDFCDDSGAKSFADSTNDLFPLDCSDDVVASAELILNHEEMGMYNNEEKLMIVEKLALAASQFDIDLADLITYDEDGGHNTMDKNSPEFKEALAEAIAVEVQKLKDGSKLSELSDQISKATKTISELEDKASKAEEAKVASADEFKSYKEDIEKEKTAVARWNTLVEKNLSFEKTADRVKASIAGMTDEQFNDYVETLSEISEAAFDKKEMDDKKKKDEEKDVDKDKNKKKEDAKASKKKDPVEESDVALANKNDDLAKASEETAVDAIFKDVLGL